MKQKLFFIIFKGLSFEQIKPTFLKGEIPNLKLNEPIKVVYTQKLAN